MTAVLDIDDLNIRFSTPEGTVNAVNGLSLSVSAGESVGIVGESGSGKSQVFLSTMGLLAKNGRAKGSTRFHGEELLGLKADRLNAIRGVRMAMIFQDPMTSLNPYLRISRQMTEVLMEHKGLSRAEARSRSIRMLERVGIPEAAKRVDMYPHEFSGGMRQRVMIAMALLCEPDLIIADEPTTALDVTIQAQILDLLSELRGDTNSAVVLITHDLGVVAGLCDRVVVMYAGRVVETGLVRDIFYSPRHPYTVGLLESIPRLEGDGEGGAEHPRLKAIDGQPPNLQSEIAGCAFAPRCPRVEERCQQERPDLIGLDNGHACACHKVGPT